MYWLGTEGLHRLRHARERAEGSAFNLQRFHDRVLSFGSIPVPLLERDLVRIAARTWIRRVQRRSPALRFLRAAGAAAAGRPSNELLIVGYDREPDTLNRFSTHILEDIQSCIVEGLTTTDERMQVVPLLAAEVPTIQNGGVRLRGDGGMDVVWKLRPGVKWHDGTPFTSADVQFTVDAINGPNYNPESTDGFDRITSVDTPDPLTAVVHYKEIYAPYDIQFIRGALPKHILQGRDIDRAQDYNRNPLGTGPYHVVEWKSGEYILLERVPHYWRGDEYPKIRRLLFKFIPNTNTRINQLKGGEVHVVALAPWDKYREIAGRAVDRRRQDARQRLRARDAERAAVSAVRGRASQARADFSARSRAIHADDPRRAGAGRRRSDSAGVVGVHRSHRAGIAFDPARASALLDDAGWKTGADGIRERDGKRLAFTLITQAGFAIRESVAQAIERQLRDVGVDVRVELHDGTAISAIWFEGRSTRCCTGGRCRRTRS